jgi:hypothetical protein
VWAATPREAGWIKQLAAMKIQLSSSEINN